MAPKKAQSKRPPSPASSYTSSSEDEPENQAKPSQVPNKTSGAALKAPQTAPPKGPQSSSEDDTDYSSDDSDSTTQEKLDDKEPASGKRTSQQQAKELPPSNDSETESESESSDEGDDSPLSAQRERRTPDPSVKPTASKPTGEGSASSSKKKRKPPEAASPSKESNNDKKLKVSEAAPSPAKEGNNDTARKRFERLWSPEDEMAILKALVAFKKKHGHEPASSAEVSTLYNTVKMSFHTDFTRSQLGSKLINIRRKYSNLLIKENEHASKKKSPSANGQAALDLAKEIWGERLKNKGTELEGGNLDMEMNGPLENGGKSSKVIRPKAEFIESLATPSEKSKGDGAKSGSLPLNELASISEISEGDVSESSVIDFVANEFYWMGRDYLKKSFALLGAAECQTIEEIWKHLMLKEMEFQTVRLEAAKEIIKIVKDKMDS